MKRSAAAALAGALVSLAAMGGVAIAKSTAGGAIFYGCVKGDKVAPSTLRVDNPPDCDGSSVLTSWNAEGIPGPVGPAGPQGEPGPPGPGVKTISGLVWIDGTKSLGSGFTSSKSDEGNYEITFPPGTWSSFPVVVVSPFGLPGAFPIAEVGSVVAPGDGSATVHVLTSSTAGAWTPHDVAFWFIATAP